jgi:hypothetical protein
VRGGERQGPKSGNERGGERQGPKSGNEKTIYCFVGSKGNRQEGSVCTRPGGDADARQRGNKLVCLVISTAARTPHKQECVREKKCGTINKVRTSLDTTTTTTTKHKQQDTQHLLAANPHESQILPHPNFRYLKKAKAFLIDPATKGKTQSPKIRTHACLPCQLHHSCPTGHSTWTGLCHCGRKSPECAPWTS